jgi:hypothetical protein
VKTELIDCGNCPRTLGCYGKCDKARAKDTRTLPLDLPLPAKHAPGASGQGDGRAMVRAVLDWAVRPKPARCVACGHECCEAMVGGNPCADSPCALLSIRPMDGHECAAHADGVQTPGEDHAA